MISKFPKPATLMFSPFSKVFTIINNRVSSKSLDSVLVNLVSVNYACCNINSGHLDTSSIGFIPALNSTSFIDSNPWPNSALYILLVNFVYFYYFTQW
jgi:hypothetical protein